jgi:hypothetical protein
MNDGCGERRIALGAYVLGALEPAERAGIEAHLAGCAGCREELAGLVGMPAVLGRLSQAEAVAASAGAGAGAGAGVRVSSPAAGSRPSLLERTIAELGRRRRRQRLRWRVGVATGAAAVVAMAAAVGVLVVTRPAPAAPAVAQFSGADPSTGVRASAELYAETWGTSIHLDVSGVTPGDQCELVAIGQNGSQQVAGTWKVGYTGGVQIDGATGISPGQLSSLQIVTTSGSELVALQG